MSYIVTRRLLLLVIAAIVLLGLAAVLWAGLRHGAPAPAFRLGVFYHAGPSRVFYHAAGGPDVFYHA